MAPTLKNIFKRNTPSPASVTKTPSADNLPTVTEALPYWAGISDQQLANAKQLASDIFEQMRVKPDFDTPEDKDAYLRYLAVELIELFYQCEADYLLQIFYQEQTRDWLSRRQWLIDHDKDSRINVEVFSRLLQTEYAPLLVSFQGSFDYALYRKQAEAAAKAHVASNTLKERLKCSQAPIVLQRQLVPSRHTPVKKWVPQIIEEHQLYSPEFDDMA